MPISFHPLPALGVISPSRALTVALESQLALLPAELVRLNFIFSGNIISTLSSLVYASSSSSSSPSNLKRPFFLRTYAGLGDESHNRLEWDGGDLSGVEGLVGTKSCDVQVDEVLSPSEPKPEPESREIREPSISSRSCSCKSAKVEGGLVGDEEVEAGLRISNWKNSTGM